MRIHGVDFSGAKQAGEKTWVAAGTPDGAGLHVDDCRSMADRGARDRAASLRALRDLLADVSVAGIDVSFGLPRRVLPDGVGTWTAAVEWFPGGHDSPDALQSACRERARAVTDGERADLKRATDEPTGASSPYSFIVYKQTFYALRDVLGPLVRDGRVACAPMQPTDDGRPVLVEVYPAATLRALDLPDERYKGRHEAAPDRRERIVDGLTSAGVSMTDEVRERALADGDGDALDAVIAAFATYRAWRTGFEPSEPWDDLEGHIYV